MFSGALYMSRWFGGLFLSFFIVYSFPAYTQTSTKPPNIVLILVDDLGWRDTEPYGNTHIDTPRISQLARQGMRYTTAYANAPVCSPSRVSILTGKNPARAQYSGHITAIGRHRYPGNSAIIPPADRMDISLRDQTLAELLKPAGYVSASIGKWHVGREGFWPHDQGFDINIGG
jgi:arylsulfatase A